MKPINISLFVTLFLLLNVVTNSLWAQADQSPSHNSLMQWNAEIEQSIKQLENPGLDDETLKRLREKLTDIRDGARIVRNDIAAEAGPLNDELSALGPPPAEGEPKESGNIAKKRALLNERLSAIDGRVKEAELLLSRTDMVLKQLAAIRIDRFTKKIFSRGLSALAPEVWRKAVPELREKLVSATNQFEQWRASETFPAQFRSVVFHMILALAAAFAIVWPFSRWFARKFEGLSEMQAPSYVELLRRALVVAGVRIFPPIALTCAAYLVLEYDLRWTQTTGELAFLTFQALLMIILVTGLSHAVLSPGGGRWRLMPLDDGDARYIHKVIIGLVWVFAVDWVLDDWLTASGASLELMVLRKFLVGLLITGLLLALLVRRKLWRSDVEHRMAKGGKAILWSGLRGLIAVLVLMIPVSAIAGYVAFSRLLGTQIVLTGSLYVLVGVVAALCSELIEELLNKDTAIGSKIWLNLELTDEGSEVLEFWLKAAVNLVIYLSAFLTLLVIWGAGGEDINEWLYTALFGFKIAGVTVSIATLFIAIAFFSGILLLTRLLQRFLEHRILPRTRIDFGIQNSIRAAVGYIGFIIAAVFAISFLGIDLTKLAIIAGALSVGIGFGLQNVVNNFVSGLILLIERPIKVGDWVVVGDKQGYVRNIKVRATEIQTFDRASVFIPNSDLISHALLNWTHADKTGRVIVPVGVAYGTDTREVRDILLEVASAHPAVFKTPAPSVLFKGFGDSSLNFELRAFIHDVDKVMAVNSDLCFGIDAAFRSAGVEIPFPQQDIHWKDIERLEHLVEKILTGKKSQ